jgi:hypothetical protein
VGVEFSLLLELSGDFFLEPLVQVELPRAGEAPQSLGDPSPP